jgi:hypothetical protein
MIGIATMDDSEKLDLYRQALVQICQREGGGITLPPPGAMPEPRGTLMYRATLEGGTEFKFVPDEPAH